jgi:NitT/TauT family transport system substrate-binding protein
MRATLSLGLRVVLGSLLLLAACGAPANPVPANPPAATVPASSPPTAVPATASATPPPSAVVHVRFGSIGVSTDLGVFIAMDRGYFRDEGIETEIVPFSSSPDLIPALATGEIQTAGSSANAAFFNAAARGLNLKVVADKGGCAPGACAYALVVRKDLVDSGAVRDWADLRGRRIAVNSRGVNSMVNLVEALAKGGMTEQDVDLVEMNASDQLAALSNGGIDAGIVNEPQVGQGLVLGTIVRWKGAEEIMPYYQQAGTLLYGGRFIAEQPDVARRWMVAYVRAQRDYYAAVIKNGDRGSMLDLLTRYTSLKDRAMLEAVQLHAANPDGYLNVQSLQSDLDAFLKLGVVSQPVDLASVIDQQFVDYAVGRLGRAAP